MQNNSQFWIVVEMLEYDLWLWPVLSVQLAVHALLSDNREDHNLTVEFLEEVKCLMDWCGRRVGPEWGENVLLINFSAPDVRWGKKGQKLPLINLKACRLICRLKLKMAAGGGTCVSEYKGGQHQRKTIVVAVWGLLHIVGTIWG